MAVLEHASDWVFLRGLVRESAHWDDFPRDFSRTIRGARVYPMDLPGNGMHWRLQSFLTISDTAEYVRREFFALRGPEHTRPLYLFSISLGSMVAIEWMHLHPGEVAGAVLVNTSSRTCSPFFRRLSWRVWPHLLYIFTARDPFARERSILKLTARSSADNAALLHARVRTSQKHPVRRRNALRQLCAAARYRPPPKQPPVPMLLLNSLGDRLVDPACSDALARVWGAALHIHPAAGHDLPLDDPGWTLDTVAAWLRRS